MLIVLLDEPGLFVFSTPDAAVIDIEAPDAESGLIRAAFDEHAVPYAVEWLRPNTHRKSFLGFLSTVEFGEYRFVPAGPPDRSALVRLLEEHPKFTTPPGAEAELAALLSRLRSNSSV
jgi:hypothetical protein